MIRAYPGQPSVRPGDTLTLHAATDSARRRCARFRVTFYRWGDGPEQVHRSGWLPGAYAGERGADQDWEWPDYAFPIPSGWPPGVYIADFEEQGGKQTFDLARGHGAALFVLRADGSGNAATRRANGWRAGRLLYKLPLATYHAYNRSGGGCFYDRPPRSIDPPGARVSLRRPGGGIGGPVWGAPDYYDAGSPRQSFAHWDARFIAWLARSGYAADFCTDLDIHADPGLLRGYDLLVSAGHDEYWSEATRNACEDFVGAGGNLAFFGANLCWWRIHPVANGAAMVCHQGGPQGAQDHWWPRTGAARSEDSLSGASYRHGGGWWDGPRQTRGYLVQQPDHWVFAGTGLTRGAVLGRDTWPPLAGYECDGAPLDAWNGGSGDSARGSDGCHPSASHDNGGSNSNSGNDDRAGAGLLRLAAWAGEAGTPPGYEVLAAAPLGPDWQELPPRERNGAGEGLHAATLGLFQRTGTVFSAGTTDWAQVLGCARDRRVERITRNVLDRLLHI